MMNCSRPSCFSSHVSSLAVRLVMVLLGAGSCFVLLERGSEAADSESPSSQSSDSGRVATEVGDWLNEAEGALTHLAGVAEALQRVRLRAAKLDSARRPDRALLMALLDWHPEWEERLQTVEGLRELVVGVQPRWAFSFATQEEGLVLLGKLGRESHAKVLAAFDTVRLENHLARLVTTEGPLLRSIRSGRKAFDETGAPAQHGLAALLPAVDDTLASLGALQRALVAGPRHAPAQAEEILTPLQGKVGEWLERWGALAGQLRAATLAAQIRFENEASVAPFLARLQERHPELEVSGASPLRIPSGISGNLFRLGENLLALEQGGELFLFHASIEEFHDVARWLQSVEGDVDAGAIASRFAETLLPLTERVAPLRTRMPAFHAAFRVPDAVLEGYVEILSVTRPGSPGPQLDDLRRMAAWDEDLALAHLFLGEGGSGGILEDSVDLLARHVVVDVQVSEPVEGGVTPRLWAAVPGGTRVVLKASGTRWTGLVPVPSGMRTLVLFGGEYDGAPLRQVGVGVPPAPRVVRIDYVLERQSVAAAGQAVAAAGPGQDTGGESSSELDVDELLVTARGAQLPVGPAETDTEASSIAAREGLNEETLDEQDLVRLMASVEINAVRDVRVNETEEIYGLRPTDLGDAGFEELRSAVAAGDVEGAKEVYARVVGGSPDEATVAIDVLVGEAAVQREFEQHTRELDSAYTGPAPPSDGEAFETVGLAPEDVVGVVRVDSRVVVPIEADLAPPPEPASSSVDVFRRERAASQDRISQLVREQRDGVKREESAVSDVLRNFAVPTLGGLESVEVGSAHEVTISIWSDSGDGDDRVQLRVGEATLDDDLAIQKSKQTFRVRLSELLTPLSIVAHETGSDSQNTAVLEIATGDEILATTSWKLEEYEVGATILRRSP